MRKKTILFNRLFIIGLLIASISNCKKDNPIVKKDVVITWANPADITVGTLLSTVQLNATADLAGTFIYTPAIGTVLSVGANQNLKVDFTPTDAVHYNTATKTVSINVTAKKDPIITWANPSDIISGTALSTAQLNATANVAGAFVYTPAIGIVLSIGVNQNLKVDFTPTDAANYNTATKTVTINVTAKKTPIITWANPLDIISGTALSATQLNATADVAGAFVYTPAIGTVLGVGANQNLKVEFTPTDAANYSTATKTVTINVTAITTVTDIDGNVYHTVTIGTQVWMVENLKTTRYRDGSAIPNITSSTAWSTQTGAYCWYNNDATTYKATYGALYNWFTVADSRNLCPTSWHVPTDAEWTTLTNYLGGLSVAGGKLKETGFTHWSSPNTGATNETGFTALPGGYRYYDGTFRSIGIYGFWWSATEYFTNYAWYRNMYCNDSDVYFNSNYYKELGFSVRCVRD